jgi:hypothetical protein
MIILGLVMFAAAVAAAIILIAQNNDATLNVHALGHTSNVHAYWLLVAGLVIAVVGLAALAIMRSGGARYRRLRREHRLLVRDHERLADSYSADGMSEQRVPLAPAHSAALDEPAEIPSAAPAPATSGRIGRLLRPRQKGTQRQRVDVGQQPQA